MRTADAAVLGEANSTVRRKLTGLDLPRSRFDQSTKFLALLFRDGRSQVLDLRHVLAHEDDQSHIGDAADPGVADQLRVERQQTFRLLGVPAGSGLPVDQATRPVEGADGNDICDELVAIRERSNELHLQVLARRADANAILLSQLLKEVDSLVCHPVPGVTLAIFEWSIAIGPPFLEKLRRAILATKVGSQCLLETTAKDHRRPGVLLLPAVEVAISITTRAGQVLGDLGVAIDHRRPLHPYGPMRRRPPPSLLPEQRTRGSKTTGRSISCGKSAGPHASPAELFRRPHPAREGPGRNQSPAETS